MAAAAAAAAAATTKSSKVQVPARIHVLLTGSPGVGKTTAVKKICEILDKEPHRVSLHGFYTEELRQHGSRVGFDVVTLDGHRGPLARTITSTQESNGCRPAAGRTMPRVGNYLVDVDSFEGLALRALEVTSAHAHMINVIVVDEIGKMEMFSDRFRRHVENIFAGENRCLVLGTIPSKVVTGSSAFSFVRSLAERRDTVVYTVTRQNRDNLVQQVIDVLKQSLSSLETND